VTHESSKISERKDAIGYNFGLRRMDPQADLAFMRSAPGTVTMSVAPQPAREGGSDDAWQAELAAEDDPDEPKDNWNEQDSEKRDRWVCSGRWQGLGPSRAGRELLLRHSPLFSSASVA